MVSEASCIYIMHQPALFGNRLGWEEPNVSDQLHSVGSVVGINERAMVFPAARLELGMTGSGIAALTARTPSSLLMSTVCLTLAHPKFTAGVARISRRASMIS